MSASDDRLLAETDDSIVVHLLGDLFTVDDLNFARVEVSKNFPYPLVRVVYRIKGKDLWGGLRLDVGKRVFLDHFEEPEMESTAQKIAPQIADRITSVMLGLLREPARR